MSEEIERLRADIAKLEKSHGQLQKVIDGLTAELAVAQRRADYLSMDFDRDIKLYQAELAAERAENKRLAKSRDRWGQRYNKVLGQLRAAVFTDTDYIKAVDEAAEKAIQERNTALDKVAKLREALVKARQLFPAQNKCRANPVLQEHYAAIDAVLKETK